MSGEPDVGFSNKTGGMHPPSKYCYPVPPDQAPYCRDIPYPFVPGGTPEPDNPGDLNDETD